MLKLILVGCIFASASVASILDQVKSRGYLQCGVSQSLAGFSYLDDTGQWSGLDVDVCRAVASAIFSDSTKVRFTPLSAKERFTALQSGEIDLLSRNTTWTLHRDAALGINFTNITFYDGQGFMLPKSLGVTSPKQLSGAILCTNSGTTTELNVADYFHSNSLQYEILTFEKADEVVAAYDAGRCDVYTTDRSALAAQRTKLSNPENHIILDHTISKEPLGPAVRQSDDNWADVIRWVVNGIVMAEELNISSKNIKQFLTSTNPEIRRLLGIDAKLGESMGLSNDFMLQVISQVGNYGEIFDKNVGKHSKLNLSRGLNDLWNKGGLQYSPPFR